MRWINLTVFVILALLAGPLIMIGGGNVLGKDWWEASRESASIAPDPKTTAEAVVQVYAARAFSWRGAFGVHSWIAVKPTDAPVYTVYSVVGWRAYHGGSALVVEDDIPDRHWYDSKPEILADLRGPGVDEIIRRIDHEAKRYPYADTYTLWPGPNSNTFTAWIGRRVPELKLDLPPTAIGKDWLGADGPVAGTPSGTGFQVSLFGVLGFLVGIEEGIEFNLAGFSFGVDPLDLALRLPGIGRIGFINNNGTVYAETRN